MKIDSIIVRTGVARAGMTVAEFFEECMAHRVAGIPFCDEKGRVTGRVSIRHVLKHTFLPSDLEMSAHLLGDDLRYLKIQEGQLARVMGMPVDNLVIKAIPCIHTASPLIKALAIMEEFHSSYIFVIDSDAYQGIVTRMGITELLLKAART